MALATPRWHIAILTAVSLLPSAQAAAPASKRPPSQESAARPPSPIVPRSNVLTDAPWKGVPITPLSSADLDALVAAELREDKIKPAPTTTDEQFLRRVTLDLTGRLPSPQDVAAFAADRDP